MVLADMIVFISVVLMMTAACNNNKKFTPNDNHSTLVELNLRREKQYFTFIPKGLF